MNKYLVMDVGGTFVKYALMSEDGTFLEHDKIPTDHSSRENYFASLFTVIDTYKNQIQGIAICQPGRIDYKRGYSYTAGALSGILAGCPVADIIHDHCHLPVTVGNDGKCAAAAEAWSGALRDVADGVVYVIGTGIGGGVVINHRVHMGYNFAAGELSDLVYYNDRIVEGYSRVEARELAKQIGFRNLPEKHRAPFFSNYVSATALLVGYAERKGIEDFHTISGEEFFEAYRYGDADAREILETMCYRIASEVISIQAVIDVQRIAIGGGMSAAPELIPLIQKTVHTVFERQGPTFPCLEPEIVPCTYGNDANLLGALRLHLDH